MHEEGQLLDTVVTVTLDEPLAQRDELNGRVRLVKGQPLSREGVVLLFLVTVVVANNAEVIRVRRVCAVQVQENGLLLGFAV